MCRRWQTDERKGAEIVGGGTENLDWIFHRPPISYLWSVLFAVCLLVKSQVCVCQLRCDWKINHFVWTAFGRSVGEKKEEEEEVEVEWWWQDIIKCAQCNWEEVPLTFAILLWRKLNSTFIASKLLCCCSCTICGSIQYRYMYIVGYPEPEGFFPNSSVSCCSLGFVVFSPDLPFPFAAIRCATQKVWEKTRNSISINVVADLFLSTRGAVLVNFFSRWEYGQVRRRRRSLFAGESIKFIYCGRWRSLLSNILNTKHEEEASRLNTVLGFCPTAPTRLL